MWLLLSDNVTHNQEVTVNNKTAIVHWNKTPPMVIKGLRGLHCECDLSFNGITVLVNIILNPLKDKKKP